MPASDSAPITTTLHQSIEQLIAEALKQSHQAHEAELDKLNAALASALSEIENSQQALGRAAEALRAVLEDNDIPITVEDIPAAATEAVAHEPLPAAEEPASTEVSPAPIGQRGPHELDVIAHGSNISNAKELQSLLSNHAEVSSAQIREFVNGELRLQLSLTSALDRAALDAWLAQHGGVVVTATDSVVEIHFDG